MGGGLLKSEVTERFSLSERGDVEDMTRRTPELQEEYIENETVNLIIWRI